MLRIGLLIASLTGIVVILSINISNLTAVQYESSFSISSSTQAGYSSTTASEQSEKRITDTRDVIIHQPLPETTKAIYMTACVAGTPSFRNKLMKLAEETEVNSIIIDVKDFSGTISFPPESEA